MATKEEIDAAIKVRPSIETRAIRTLHASIDRTHRGDAGVCSSIHPPTHASSHIHTSTHAHRPRATRSATSRPKRRRRTPSCPSSASSMCVRDPNSHSRWVFRLHLLVYHRSVDPPPHPYTHPTPTKNTGAQGAVQGPDGRGLGRRARGRQEEGEEAGRGGRGPQGGHPQGRQGGPRRQARRRCACARHRHRRGGGYGRRRRCGRQRGGEGDVRAAAAGAVAGDDGKGVGADPGPGAGPRGRPRAAAGAAADVARGGEGRLRAPPPGDPLGAGRHVPGRGRVQGDGQVRRGHLEGVGHRHCGAYKCVVCGGRCWCRACLCWTMDGTIMAPGDADTRA